MLIDLLTHLFVIYVLIYIYDPFGCIGRQQDSPSISVLSQCLQCDPLSWRLSLSLAARCFVVDLFFFSLGSHTRVTACLCSVAFEAGQLRVSSIHLLSHLRISFSAGFWSVHCHTYSTDLEGSSHTGAGAVTDPELCFDGQVSQQNKGVSMSPPQTHA